MINQFVVLILLFADGRIFLSVILTHFAVRRMLLAEGRILIAKGRTLLDGDKTLFAGERMLITVGRLLLGVGRLLLRREITLIVVAVLRKGIGYSTAILRF